MGMQECPGTELSDLDSSCLSRGVSFRTIDRLPRPFSIPYMTTFMRRVCALLFVCLGVSALPAAAQSTTALFFDSQAGDYIGQGQQNTWTPSTRQFTSRTEFGMLTVMVLKPSGFGGWSLDYQLSFHMPFGGALAVGTYERAQRGAFAANRPGLDINGNGRACNEVTGRFQIYEIEYDAGGALTKLAVDFEQHCSDAVPALFGALRYNSSRATLVPFNGAYPVYSMTVDSTPYGRVTGPGVDCGAGATDCAEAYAAVSLVTLTVAPVPGYVFLSWSGDCKGGALSTTVQVNRRWTCTPSFDAIPGSGVPPPRPAGILFIDSEPGEWVGQGHRWIRSTAESAFTVIATASKMTATITDGTSTWWVRLSAPVGTSLAPGTYEQASRDAFRSPLVPGMDVSAESRGCNMLAGRFTVYEYAVNAFGAVDRISIDFEQRCDDQTPALHGAIRYNGTRNTLIPFDGAYPSYELHLEASPNGTLRAQGFSCATTSGTDCRQALTAPTTVSVAATPNPGYVFMGWTGDCVAGQTTSVFINRRKRCGAVFDSVSGRSSALPPGLGQGALFVDSQAGDWVGAGQRRVLVADRAEFGINSASTESIEFFIKTPYATWWRLKFSAPVGQSLRPGDFNASARFSSATVPGLDIAAESRGCFDTSGRFRVYEFEIAGSTLVSFSADFEQRCDGRAPALVGSIRYKSARSSLMPFLSFTPGALPAMMDFNRDGWPDLVWRHAATGHNAIWMMNGSSVSSTTFFSPEGAAQLSDLNWEIRALGDLNADRQPDVIWQNKSTGQIAVWFFAGTTCIGTDYIYTLSGGIADPDRDWQIVAAGDADRDGQTDLLWRHRTSGETRIWHMFGHHQSDSVTVPGISDPLWEIAGLADMNGDGWLDLVWRHYGNGAIACWLMYDSRVVNTLWLTPSVNPDVNWRLVGVADMNRDGSPDLVWQHLANGQLGVWYMRDLAMIGGGYLNPWMVADPNWRIVGIR
jgi:hypothetical protein